MRTLLFVVVLWNAAAPVWAITIPPLVPPITYVDSAEVVGFGDQPEMYLSLGPGLNVPEIPPEPSRLRFRGYAESFNLDDLEYGQVLITTYRAPNQYEYEFLGWVELPPAIGDSLVPVPFEFDRVFPESYPLVSLRFYGGYAEDGMRMVASAEYTIGVPEPTTSLLALPALAAVWFARRRRGA